MINIISKLFYFLLFFIICIGLLELFFFFILRKKKITSGVKMQVFGILMEYNNTTIFALSTILVKFLWTLFILINGMSLNKIDLIILVFLSIVFGITSLSFKNGILETFSSFAMYFSLFCYKLLCNYLVDVRVEWYVVLGTVLLFIFIFIYASFFTLRNLNYLVSKTRYIRSFRYED